MTTPMTLSLSKGGSPYCVLHGFRHAAVTHCPHCVAAALINELRQMCSALESRIADQDDTIRALSTRRTAADLCAQDRQAAHNAVVGALEQIQARLAELETAWKERTP